jgi:4-amino-4-deoxy-L-arabinose transferase-like glycosyltransferase
MAIALEPGPATAVLPDRRSGLASQSALALLGGILILALGLRLSGLGSVYHHPDEHIYVDRAEQIVRTGDANPRYFQNPSLFTYLVAAELAAAKALGLRNPESTRSTSGTPPSYLLARLASALLGTLSVFLTYATGATLFGWGAGLGAASLLAVSLLHVRDSHYGVSDVPSAALLLLSLYFAARVLRQPTLRWFVLAALAGGLATSAKYTAGFFVAPLLVAHWTAHRRSGVSFWSPRACLWLLAAGAAGLAGYLLGTPYTLLDAPRFWSDFRGQYGLGSSATWGQPELPVAQLWVLTLLQGFGVAPLLLAAAGMGLLIRRGHWGQLLFLTALPLVLLTFFLPKAVFYPRLVIPLLGSLALLAGYAVLELAHCLPQRWRAAGVAALTALALTQSVVDSVRHDWLLTQADTREVAAAWLRTNLPPKSSVLLGPYSPSADLSPLRVERLRLGPRDDGVLQTAVQRGVRFVVVSSFVYGRDEHAGRTALRRDEDATRSRLRQIHRSLEQEWLLIGTISPGRDGRELPFRKDDAVASPFWNLHEYERPGPTLRIYQLPPRPTGSRGVGATGGRQA